MSDVDLTEAVEEAARVRYERVRRDRSDSTPPWHEASPIHQHAWREGVLAEVTAAAPLIERQVREQIARDEVLSAGSDPAWAKCEDHPGRENHCASGFCGICWLCKEQGRDESHDEAYSSGMRSAERRIAARIARGGAS